MIGSGVIRVDSKREEHLCEREAKAMELEDTSDSTNIQSYIEFKDRIVSMILTVIQWFCKPRPADQSQVSTSEMSTLEDVSKDNGVINRSSAPEGVRKINDMLYEIYTDGNDDSEVIVIFFHGLIRSRDVDQGSNNIHVSTWTSKEEGTDSEVLWPRIWLVHEFPKSRIYTVKYDASIKATGKDGRISPYNMVENLMHDLIFAFSDSSQFWSRPVVLVGHSIGGIIIKELLLFAERRSVEGNDVTRKMACSNFLENVKLIFYFSTPHLGMEIKLANEFWTSNENMEQYVLQLNGTLARLNSSFEVLANQKGWTEAGVGEGTFTRWDSINFDGLVVKEASARHGTHGNYLSLPEDHFSISRPKSKIADGFQHLVKHIKDVVPPVHPESAEAQKPTRLYPSQILRVGDSRRSLNRVYRLLMQKDNNLVLQGRDRQVIWSSNTPRNFHNCYCVMQTDGNAVIYGIQKEDRHLETVWATGTNCSRDHASRYIEVQNDGNLVMYDEWRRPVWATNTWDINVLAAARLTSDQVLERGAFLMSQNEGYKLDMQDDCNLVLYHSTGSELLPVWATNTDTSEKVNDCYFKMQADGNAVLYAGNTESLNLLWSTRTASQTAGTYYIELHDDGIIVMWDNLSLLERKAVWSTGRRGGPMCTNKITSGQVLYGGDFRVSLNRLYIFLMQWDGNLVLYKKDEGQIWASDTACQSYQNAILSGGTVNCYFTMDPNGNAEIHVGSKVPWSTPRQENRRLSNGTFYIEVQNDGNVAMYDMVDKGYPRKQLWATNTARAL